MYASKRWMAENRTYSEGEIGQMLVSLLASLAAEGDKACSIQAYLDSSIPIASRQEGQD